MCRYVHCCVLYYPHVKICLSVFIFKRLPVNSMDHSSDSSVLNVGPEAGLMMVRMDGASSAAAAAKVRILFH